MATKTTKVTKSVPARAVVCSFPFSRLLVFFVAIPSFLRQGYFQFEFGSVMDLQVVDKTFHVWRRPQCRLSPEAADVRLYGITTTV